MLSTLRSQKRFIWSEEQNNTLVDYMCEGKSTKEISVLMNIDYIYIIRRKTYLKKLLNNNKKNIKELKLQKKIYDATRRRQLKEMNNTLPKERSIRWTLAETEQLKTLLKEGYSIKDISNIMSIPYRRITSRLKVLNETKNKKNEARKIKYQKKKQEGIITTKTCKAWTISEIEKLVSLIDEGQSYVEVAKLFNRSKSALSQRYKLYKDAAMFSPVRFAEPWTDEEINYLSNRENKIYYLPEQWQRSRAEIILKRDQIMRSKITGCKIGKAPITIVKIIKNAIHKARKTYSLVPRKDYVQQTLYKSLSNLNSPLLTLLGPTPERFLNMLNEYNIVGDNFIYSHEIDLDVFVKVAKTLTNKNINITFGDIIAATPQKLIDLDLMGRWETQNTLIKNLFNKQKCLNGDKYFMFTLSVRGIENIDICSHIQTILYELLNINYTITCEKIYFDEKLYVDKYSINNNIQAFRYADTSPMISILIKH
jgi:hypothetical protein